MKNKSCFLATFFILISCANVFAMEYYFPSKKAAPSSNWSQFVGKQLNILDSRLDNLRTGDISDEAYKEAMILATSATILGESYTFKGKAKGENAFKAGFKNSITAEESKLAIRLLQHLSEYSIHTTILNAGAAWSGLNVSKAYFEKDDFYALNKGLEVTGYHMRQLSEVPFDKFFPETWSKILKQSFSQNAPNKKFHISQTAFILQVIAEKLDGYFLGTTQTYYRDIVFEGLQKKLENEFKFDKEEGKTLLENLQKRAIEVAKIVKVEIPKLKNSQFINDDKFHTLVKDFKKTPEYKKATKISTVKNMATLGGYFIDAFAAVTRGSVSAKASAFEKVIDLFKSDLKKYPKGSKQLENTIEYMLGIEGQEFKYKAHDTIVHGDVTDIRNEMHEKVIQATKLLFPKQNFNPEYCWTLGVISCLYLGKIPPIVNKDYEPSKELRPLISRILQHLHFRGLWVMMGYPEDISEMLAA